MLNEKTYYLAIIIIAIWTIPWKGAALWRAAKNSQKWWFIALLVLNTLAILDILYILFFSKNNQPDRINQ